MAEVRGADVDQIIKINAEIEKEIKSCVKSDVVVTNDTEISTAQNDREDRAENIVRDISYTILKTGFIVPRKCVKDKNKKLNVNRVKGGNLVKVDREYTIVENEEEEI